MMPGALFLPKKHITLIAAAIFTIALFWAGCRGALIRHVFNNDGRKTNSMLEKHVPQEVNALPNQQYIPGNKQAYFDVYYPPLFRNETAPTLVWIHGGAWIAGDKEYVANYCKVIAGKGYTVIALNYSLAPKQHFPIQAREINTALAFLLKNAKALHVDTGRIALAGDSGGAQLAALLACLSTNHSYARLLNITPALRPHQLKGAVLFCGPYQMQQDVSSGFLKTVLESYSGTPSFLTDTMFAKASVINYITPEFPATFISVGNGDPLANQSYEMKKTLEQNSIPVDTLFFDSLYKPSQPHEYQFKLDTPEGRLAFERMLAFMNKTLQPNITP